VVRPALGQCWTGLHHVYERAAGARPSFCPPTARIRVGAIGQSLLIWNGVVTGFLCEGAHGCIPFTSVLWQHETVTLITGDALVFMDGGVVVKAGEPRAVLAHPQHERTKSFLAKVL